MPSGSNMHKNSTYIRAELLGGQGGRFVPLDPGAQTIPWIPKAIRSDFPLI